ncbi:hypothetical protein SAMN05421766_10686 [Zobellia uliginosa]|uniref:DUF4179 domain-containing protein n=1 Tax=Zobellia uliginosa TaxID=143224 RepID=A0ABY1L3L2_9FLAO|nr:hypothetical protein [Zobellia uliginosa]SIS98463.1 hypothetical protein SAMN05421766_10686 [Zobellia uliginosa]
MEKDNIDHLFENLNGSFDHEIPAEGHELRFLQKLNAQKGAISLKPPKRTWYRPMGIAACLLVLLAAGIGLFRPEPSLEEKVAKISPEISRTEFYFASLIEEQVNELQNETSPETKKIVDDTMVQLNKLEVDYKQLEEDLINGGNSKAILSAMITNFQTRINLLQDVLETIETIKNLKKYDDSTTI